MAETYFHQKILQEELAKRSERNSSYSLRAFAKALEVDPAVMSRVLSGSRTLSAPVARRITQRLNLAPAASQNFLASVASSRKRSIKKPKAVPSNDTQMEYISADIFRVISDWYHYAILELTFTPNFEPSPRWISKALGISATQAKLAVTRLLKLGLLEEKNGTLIKSQKNITTADKSVTTPALRRHQQQILENALTSLENDPIAERNMTGMTMAINPEKISEAKKYIGEFMNNMCSLLEEGANRQVYQLGVCLYPIQRKEI